VPRGTEPIYGYSYSSPRNTAMSTCLPNCTPLIKFRRARAGSSSEWRPSSHIKYNSPTREPGNDSSHPSPFRIPASRQEDLTFHTWFAPSSSHSRNKVCNLVNHMSTSFPYKNDKEEIAPNTSCLPEARPSPWHLRPRL